MANTRLPMRKIKEVLRLKHHCRLSRRQIAHSLTISRSTAADYLERAEQAGISVRPYWGRVGPAQLLDFSVEDSIKRIC
jgi:response regulator of citrate/malate metabolism